VGLRSCELQLARQGEEAGAKAVEEEKRQPQKRRKKRQDRSWRRQSERSGRSGRRQDRGFKRKVRKKVGLKHREKVSAAESKGSGAQKWKEQGGGEERKRGKSVRLSLGSKRGCSLGLEWLSGFRTGSGVGGWFVCKMCGWGRGSGGGGDISCRRLLGGRWRLGALGFSHPFSCLLLAGIWREDGQVECT
jgi:hypothetical protein